MPNTLGHLGIQGLASRAVFREIDLKWIGVGCVIPDLPWILQRAMGQLLPDAALLDLRLYAMTLASLPLSLLLAAALSLLAFEPWRIARLLGLNVALHLLLDACQAQWGNGVHLLAPFSWQLASFGLFWPESPATVGLTLIGLVFFGHACFFRPGSKTGCTCRPAARGLAVLSLVGIYLMLPFAVLEQVEAADPLVTRQLRAPDRRPGAAIELDRQRYDPGERGGTLTLFTRERVAVTGRIPSRAGSISLRGRFIDEQTIEITELHEHWPVARDLASYVGLALLAGLWVVDLGRQRWRGDASELDPG